MSRSGSAHGIFRYRCGGRILAGFKLRLEDTYWSKGFFNVPVDFERYVSEAEGPIDIFLGAAAEPTTGRMTRSAQQNATPRIFGNKPLRDFFQAHFKRGDYVFIEFVSPRSIRVGGRETAAPITGSPRQPVGPSPAARNPTEANETRAAVTASLSVGDLAELKRKLTVLLNSFDRQGSTPGEGIRKRIGRLSQAGAPIPRPIAALMVSITEMRNSAEHESKVLSASESAAVRHAWRAIEEWAESVRR